MLKVGLTGGIGSGKSTVCTFFSVLGMPVYISDIRARLLMMTDIEIIQEMKKILGDDIYLHDGSVNKQLLTKHIFEHEDTRQKINSIVHPKVKADFERWVREQDKSLNYVMQESALLFESGHWKDIDVIVTVTCPLEERINRLMKRDDCDRETVEKKISSQLPEEYKIENSDFVIHNSSNDIVIKQVLKIHETLIQRKF